MRAIDLAPRLLPLLGDRDPDVVSEAAFALEQLVRWGAPAAPLAPRLAVRVRALGTLPSDAAAIVVGALAAIGSDPDARILVPRLRDARPAVRAAVASAIVRLDPGVDPAWLLPLVADPAPLVRQHAARALGATRGGSSVVEALGRALRDTVPAVRIAAYRALARIGTDGAADALLARFAGESDVEVLVPALGALAAVAPEGGAARIRPHVHSPWPQVRAAALEAFGAYPNAPLGHERALLAGDASPSVRRALARAIGGRLGAAEDTAALAFLDDPSPAVRAAAVDVFARAADEDPEIARRIGAATADSDPRVRARAVAAMARMDPSLAEPVLVAALGDPDPYVVAGAIGALPPARARALVGDVRPEMRVPVRRALARAAAAVERASLAPFLSDPDLAVRLAALDPLDRPSVARGPAWAGALLAPQPLRRARAAPPLERLPFHAEIVTPRGAVVVRLHPREAPRTVARFARLAKLGHYDGSEFGWVFGDSLVIGGVPVGGRAERTGETIRDEVNALAFVRGRVGFFAPAPDAGEAAFFVALRDDATLDGRATAFGTVIHGITLVDRLDPGDRIQTVRVR